MCSLALNFIAYPISSDKLKLNILFLITKRYKPVGCSDR